MATIFTAAILSPFSSLRSIWNKRAKSENSTSVTVSLPQEGLPDLPDAEIKIASSSLNPISPLSANTPFLRKLLHGRRDSSKTLTGLHPDLERAYKSMLILERRDQIKFDVPRRVRRKLAPLVKKELAAGVELDWSSLDSIFCVKHEVEPASMIGSSPAFQANAIDTGINTQPSLPIPSLPTSTENAANYEVPGFMAIMAQQEPGQQEFQAKSSASKYVYGLPNVKTRMLIALHFSKVVKTDLPWSRKHIVYPQRSEYELPPGMKGSKIPITSSVQVWKLNREKRKRLFQKLGFTITRFLVVPTLKAIPEVDDV